MEKLNILRSGDEIYALREYLKDKEYVAFDTETTGLDKSSTVIGFSVCADVGEAFYVILAYWDVPTQKLVNMDNYYSAISLLLDLTTKKIIGHNILFDVSMIQNNFKIDLLPAVFHDTMISGHLLNENESQGLKERGIRLYGDDAGLEQKEMKASVTNNGGLLTKTQYELYKADPDLIAKYGAKDAILTMKLFYEDVPRLYESGLDKFFYEDESMPLLRTATYELNYAGLKVDQVALAKLKSELISDIEQARAYINQEIAAHVKEEYPGTSASSTFNIDSPQQLSWLVFIKLNNMFGSLTKGGRALCKELNMKTPYTNVDKRTWLRNITDLKDRVYAEATYNPKTKKMGRPKKVGDAWKYMMAGKESLSTLAPKYKWIAKFLEYKKNQKLLNTYVEGIQERTKYGVIYPSFLQHGTTSGRYSSRNPNFQNLPRDDKRIKKCIIARPGKVFVGADQSQLEPRVFASISGDTRLCACFSSGDDFYSVIGAPIFGKDGLSMKKTDANSFAKLWPDLRQIAKEDISLATPYGTTAWTMSRSIEKSPDECQEIIDNYFASFPNVYNMMIESHEQAMTRGYVENLFGRPRRLPEAMGFRGIYGKRATTYPYKDLPYVARNLLNLAMNHRIQSTGASIMNRISIEVCRRKKILARDNPAWNEAKIVVQVHDSLVMEGPESLKDEMHFLVKYCMENTIVLPGVLLEAEPKIGYTLADV